MTYETRELLRSIAIYALTFGVIIIIASGGIMAINNANVKIEANCQLSGGQVMRTPGEVSRCLLPAAR